MAEMVSAKSRPADKNAIPTSHYKTLLPQVWANVNTQRQLPKGLPLMAGQQCRIKHARIAPENEGHGCGAELPVHISVDKLGDTLGAANHDK
jgi:hypothetical protein